MENKIIELETKIAYQEDLIERLNQALISQQKTLDQISLRVDRLINQISAQADSGIKDISLEVAPPHY